MKENAAQDRCRDRLNGGELGGLEYENFNAANPVITFHGVSVHTGDAKDKMINALSMACEWQQMLPAGEKPEYTEGLYVKAFTEEHLMFSLPKSHPKASAKSLHLSDINGQNMIVMPNLGFWRDIIDTEMPDSRFLEQTDRTSFEELIQASVLPYFITNLSINDYILPKDRVVIPILDDKVNVTFYLVAKEETHRKYFKL